MPFDRLHNAVTTLISGDSLGEHLATAALTIQPLQSSEFPTTSTREQFDAIGKILFEKTRTFDATIDAMDPVERHRIGGMIIGLFAEVARAGRRRS
jgi:hypothetical protein